MDIATLLKSDKRDRYDIDSVVTFPVGEGVSQEVMAALEKALSRVEDDPSKLGIDDLQTLLRIARQTNSSIRGVLFDVAV